MKVIDLLNKIANGEIEDKRTFNIVFKNGLLRSIYYDKDEENCMCCLKNVSDDYSIYDDISFDTEIATIEEENKILKKNQNAFLKIIEEAKLYLEHTSKDDFNLEEWQKENRYQAIKVILQEIERLNNIINELDNWLGKKILSWEDNENVRDTIYHERLAIQAVYFKLQELKGDGSNE